MSLECVIFTAPLRAAVIIVSLASAYDIPCFTSCGHSFNSQTL